MFVGMYSIHCSSADCPSRSSSTEGRSLAVGAGAFARFLTPVADEQRAAGRQFGTVPYMSENSPKYRNVSMLPAPVVLAFLLKRKRCACALPGPCKKRSLSDSHFFFIDWPSRDHDGCDSLITPAKVVHLASCALGLKARPELCRTWMR